MESRGVTPWNCGRMISFWILRVQEISLARGGSPLSSMKGGRASSAIASDVHSVFSPILIVVGTEESVMLSSVMTGTGFPETAAMPFARWRDTTAETWKWNPGRHVMTVKNVRMACGAVVSQTVTSEGK